jgi:hypothetical protein
VLARNGREKGREVRVIAIGGVMRNWCRLRIRKSVTMIVITRIKEAYPSTINIIWEKINNGQGALWMKGKARGSNN